MCQLSRRRQSARPTKKTTLSGIHIHHALRTLPPNEPTRPRAMPQATCGPVHASETRPSPSSTLPRAICPASPDQTLTVQRRVAASNVASVVGSAGSARASARPSGCARNVATTACSVSRGPSVSGANGCSSGFVRLSPSSPSSAPRRAPRASQSGEGDASDARKRHALHRRRNDQSLFPTKLSGVTSTIATACAGIAPMPASTRQVEDERGSRRARPSRRRGTGGPGRRRRRAGRGTSRAGSTCSCSRPRRGTIRPPPEGSARRPTSSERSRRPRG